MTPAERRRSKRRRRAQRLYEQGLTLREIADRLGCSVGTVHRDVNAAARRRYRKRAYWRKHRAGKSRRT